MFFFGSPWADTKFTPEKSNELIPTSAISFGSYLFQPIILGIHVSFPGCNHVVMEAMVDMHRNWLPMVDTKFTPWVARLHHIETLSKHVCLSTFQRLPKKKSTYIPNSKTSNKLLSKVQGKLVKKNISCMTLL